ncbi:hypothetical protein DFS34DRAFT_499926 [Phlyctochytrium arcticum]|nr:hypothetical protein DFS34DRAFT_499926 [Phlyctochytrium arcticum]
MSDHYGNRVVPVDGRARSSARSSKIIQFHFSTMIKNTPEPLKKRADTYIAKNPKATFLNFVLQDLGNLTQEYTTYNQSTHNAVIQAYRAAASARHRKHLLGEAKGKLYSRLKDAFEAMEKEAPAVQPAITINSPQIVIGNDNIVVGQGANLQISDSLSAEQGSTGAGETHSMQPGEGQQLCVGENNVVVGEHASVVVVKRKRSDDIEVEDVEVQIGKKTFNIPDITSMPTPNKPKYSAASQKLMSRNMTFATAAYPRAIIIGEYPTLLQHLKRVLGDTGSWASWDTWALALDPETLPDEEGRLWRILRHGLHSMHGYVSPNARFFQDDHERTPTADLVVPLLAPLRETGLISWHWCEYAINSKKEDPSRTGDAPRFADGLGKDPSTRDEIVFIESSGGLLKEKSEHTEGDSIKLLESACYALKLFLSKYKGASMKTARRKALMIVQFIQNRLTLSKMTLGADGRTCKVEEVRSACIPTSWDEFGSLMGVTELVAEMFRTLNEQQQINKNIRLEHNQLTEDPVPFEESIRHHMS